MKFRWLNRSPRPEPTEGWEELADIPQCDYDVIDDSTVAELLRLGELRQQALLTMAAAADARAVQFLASSAALAAASFAAAAALIVADKLVPVALGAAASGVGFTTSAVIAAIAARPEQAYAPPGVPPSQLWDASHLRGRRREVMLVALGILQRSIAVNTQSTVKRCKIANAATWCTAIAPVVGTLLSLVAFAWAGWWAAAPMAGGAAAVEASARQLPATDSGRSGPSEEAVSPSGAASIGNSASPMQGGAEHGGR